MPLEKLATSTQVGEREKIAEASRQFEAVLLRQILSQAQKPVFQSSFTQQNSTSNAIYQDMITQQLADRISHGGSFGFGKVLEKELAARYIKKEAVAQKNNVTTEAPKQLRSPRDAANNPPSRVPVAPAAAQAQATAAKQRPMQTAPTQNHSSNLPHKARPQPGKRI